MSDIEILIIDDEPQIRKLLQITLESNDYRVLQSSTGKEGLAMAASHSPELILLDIGLPDISGHDVLQELQGWFNKSVIILSVQNSENDIVKALDNGAADYLTKPFRTRELLARIRSAIRRNQSGSIKSLIVVDDLEIDLTSRIVKKKEEIVKLTPTEYKLLAVLARHEGMVLTHQFILKEVWGVSYQNETQYLRVFVAQLRKKLEENPNNPTHILTESGIGYRFC